ncbi:PAS domain-containing protein [Periweissella fabaria]|uniref:Uncharacterized protein n=1 Tax=Periweissella fabaria TaxID=546157 RepID=A0ABN8BMR0_9LACO|nr:PAS domain-containing protein [Periweissella fabaria]MCM0596977.1 PAS domain-containing protein [Periweissella fabaria]CAH0416932.1 hypothetical protein WFA24289_01249 [Periweissella fabaria]
MVDQIELEKEKTFVDNQGIINLPTGHLSLTALRQILNSLPFEITFADADDRLAYYSDNEQRIERYAASELGVSFVSLFPKTDQVAVSRMLADLHQGAANHFEQWFPKNNRTVYNNFYAVRDLDGTFLGTLRFTGDISRIQGFRGVKTFFNAGKADK